MADALRGIRVLDWSLYQVTPYAVVMRADMGADVIHIEERRLGDLLRGLSSMYGVDCIKTGVRSILKSTTAIKKVWRWI
jgi:crotonobetainyl-CoA:carnitine CoA-transferase CaiB-like acyl-CoA transferase